MTADRPDRVADEADEADEYEPNHWPAHRPTPPAPPTQLPRAENR